MGLDAEMGRLKWRCRRGMRELDKVTEGYLLKHYVDATPSQRRAFQHLLALPDPELLALIYQYTTADDTDIAHVLAAMRRL
ncbi:MAG: succinate dehydrogenase assembly factor 2 [Pseudomonadota bacterium]